MTKIGIQELGTIIKEGLYLIMIVSFAVAQIQRQRQKNEMQKLRT